MKIVCAHCGQKYDADESFIGQSIQCQSCGNSFVADEYKVMQTRCWYCKEWFEVDSYNKEVTCPKCGKKMHPMTPKQIREDDEKQKKQKRSNIRFSIGCLVVVGLITWGLVSCISSCNESSRERNKEEAVYGSKSQACVLVEQAIEKRLLNPKRSNIDFDFQNIRFDKETKTYTIPGTCEAQNAFGAMLMKRFVAKVQYDSFEYRLISLDMN